MHPRDLSDRIERFDSNPLLTPEMGERIGTNLNGPSVVRAPAWLDDPLGEYYLYFAHHGGEYIWPPYADDLRGPWTIHSPGTLSLDGIRFPYHVALPDVHVDNDAERIKMHFHGCCGEYPVGDGEMSQVTSPRSSRATPRTGATPCSPNTTANRRRSTPSG